MTGKTTNIQQTSSVKMLRAMVGIGILCALTIVLTYQGTMSRIETNNQDALQKAIFNVLPGVDSAVTLVLKGDDQLVVASTDDRENLIYAGYDDKGQLIGYAITGSGQGYADIIRVLYGYDPVKETVIGFQVLESKETPGLGDKIEKDEQFLANFKALDVKLNAEKTGLENQVIPVKSGEKVNAWEVEGITGATISSRAIGQIIDESSTFWLPIISKNKNDVSSEQ